MALESGPVHADPVLERELAHHEALYSTDGVAHFSKPAVVAFREYLVRRILRTISPESRILSIGCGVGDTELLLAPHVSHITGIDLSPTAIQHARRAAVAQNVRNVRFLNGSWQALPVAGESFNVVLSIFFLHHLGDAQFSAFPSDLLRVLGRGGRFYALEPNARRLSGFLGKLLVPHLVKKYQTEDERQLFPRSTAALFTQAGFATVTRWFDFTSTPLAGLFPSWVFGYRLARHLDGALTPCPGVRAFSSNFELIADRSVLDGG